MKIKNDINSLTVSNEPNLLNASTISDYNDQLNKQARLGLFFAFKLDTISRIYNTEDMENTYPDYLYLPIDDEGTANLDSYNDNSELIISYVSQLGYKECLKVARQFVKYLKDDCGWNITDTYEEDGCLVVVSDWSKE